MSAPHDLAATVDAVRAALVELAPSDLQVGVRALAGADVVGLHPDEEAAVAAASAVRRTEFATGRALLRSLIGPGPVPVGPSRAPVPPEPWVVSLAHDRTVAVAVAGRRPRWRAVGVDIEPEAELDSAEADIVRRPDDASIDPLAILVIKEAAYKAWSNAGGPLLDFHDLRVSVEGDHFDATPVAGGAPIGGRYCSRGGRWIALAAVVDSGGDGRSTSASGGDGRWTSARGGAGRSTSTGGGDDRSTSASGGRAGGR